MFGCRYKFELEDSVTSAKYVYRSQRRRQDKIVAVLIPILMVAMIVMLIYDIVAGNSYAWDIVLLVALVILQALYLIIPVTLVRGQKKAYEKQKLGEMDALDIQIDDNLCIETLYKDGAEVAKNVHNLRAISSYLEDETRLILVFNKVEFVCLRKANITGGVDKLKAHLEKIMAKANSKQSSKKKR